MDQQVPSSEQPPRFLRFVTALVLGTAITAIPVTMIGGCGSDDDDVTAPIDAAIDAPAPVDGPLAPPDLARVA